MIPVANLLYLLCGGSNFIYELEYVQFVVESNVFPLYVYNI